MYTKNLTNDLRLRLSDKDMDFLRTLSKDRECSVSETIRCIIGEYRRSLETMELIKGAIEVQRQRKEGGCPNGDTETNFDNIV